MEPSNYAKMFVSRPWSERDRELRQRIRAADASLQGALKKTQPSYAQLRGFVFEDGGAASVRAGIRRYVEDSTRPPYASAQEKVCLDKVLSSGVFQPQQSIYEVAQCIRSLFFVQPPAPRDRDAMMAYAPSTLIRPLAQTGQLFDPIADHVAGPPLFGAINLYLMMLAAHPFIDGNGRTARVLFNLQLASAYGRGTHYVPMDKLCNATSGLYEELLSRAGATGNFDEAILHLVSLVEAYARFVSGLPDVRGFGGDLAIAQALARKHIQGEELIHLNDMPPYLLSIRSVMEDTPHSEINARFVHATIQISQILRTYGTVQYAVTRLANLLRQADVETASISFFLATERKNDLLLRMREMATTYKPITGIRLAIATGDPTIDAKVLINIAESYSGNGSCSVILYEFEQAS